MFYFFVQFLVNCTSSSDEFILLLNILFLLWSSPIILGPFYMPHPKGKIHIQKRPKLQKYMDPMSNFLYRHSVIWPFHKTHKRVLIIKEDYFVSIFYIFHMSKANRNRLTLSNITQSCFISNSSIYFLFSYSWIIATEMFVKNIWIH